MTALRETVDLPGGARAAYEVIGAGEPMLYFQGGPGFSASMLRDDAALLSDRFDRGADVRRAVHRADDPLHRDRRAGGAAGGRG